MKKIILAIVAIMTAIGVNAQTNLTGRVYHNPNIMANMMDQEVNIDKKIAEARKEAIAKMEKKKGRKLTKEELAKIDKELAGIRKQAEAHVNSDNRRIHQCHRPRHEAKNQGGRRDLENHGSRMA